MKNRQMERFREIFGTRGEGLYFSPGRVNLIGEHIDYNGGTVLPCAITCGTWGVAAKRADRKLRMYSENFKDRGVIETDLSDLRFDPKDDWANYVKGVLYFLRETIGEWPCGLDIYVEGDIPNGAGLSSSASLEVLIGTMVNDLFCLGKTPLDIVRLSKKAENDFVGVNCGIMDQFAVGMGRKDHAVALDTRTLEYDYIPARFPGVRLVIMNTNKRRGLADSKYNERREACETALKNLQQALDISCLCQLSPEELEKYEHLIVDPIGRGRARHAVTENARVKAAVNALRRQDIRRFGQLMNESHISLRDDYEVTGKELDALVESAWKQPGVLGARMTGAGFGGCAIALVKEDWADAFVKQVGDDYTRAIGYAPDFYMPAVGDGAGKRNTQSDGD